jgi:DNA polymerase alpha-associated DNA helicase A
LFIDTSGLDYFERTDAGDGEDDEGSKSNENEASLVTRHVQKLVELAI